MTNLYDFGDTSDLPSELSNKLSKSAIANPNVHIYVGIITAAAEAGLKVMSITQVMAVAHRMGLDSKTQQSIRTALNAGVKGGYLVKPTRQTYAAAELSEHDALNGKAPVDATDETAVVDVSILGEPLAAQSDAQIDPLA